MTGGSWSAMYDADALGYRRSRDTLRDDEVAADRRAARARLARERVGRGRGPEGGERRDR